MTTIPLQEIVLAGPRGFCAGVDRAIDIVELALQVCPPPVYVRREIVHNRHVVEALRAKGAHFVDELDEVPDDATVIKALRREAPPRAPVRGPEDPAKERIGRAAQTRQAPAKTVAGEGEGLRVLADGSGPVGTRLRDAHTVVGRASGRNKDKNQ